MPGIDLSEAMVERLRAKPGGDAICRSTIGDFTTTRRRTGEFDLVYLVFNTIGNVTTQDAQVATFENAARHLRPGGCFVVETGVPGVLSLRARRAASGSSTTATSTTASTSTTPVTQAMWSHHYTRDGRRHATGAHRVPFRYAWPAEFDLMARIAGLRLRERWAWWDRTPFTATSDAHCSSPSSATPSR